MSYQDIRSIESFRQKTVLVVKAPPETELQVPQDHVDGEVCIHQLNVSACYRLKLILLFIFLTAKNVYEK